MEVDRKGKNHEDIQLMNRSLVFRSLQISKIVFRAEIAKSSGLNQATVTNIIADFLDWGLVHETGFLSGGGGRRCIAVELASDNYAIIAVRLARKHFSIGVFNLSGEYYDLVVVPIDPKEKAENILLAIQDIILNQIEKYKEKTILGVGFALPGPFIREEGKIELLTESSNWRDIDFVKTIGERTGLRVFLEHDANASLFAEWSHSQNYDFKTPIVYIMVGQGIGASIMENGKFISGKLGIAGEIGHMSIKYDGTRCLCGNYGCLETYCSTIAIQREMIKKLGNYKTSLCNKNSKFYEIIEAYKCGDKLACEVINQAAEYLGYGIANLINIINPGKIIITDELSGAGENFLKVVVNTVKERVLPKLSQSTQIVLGDLEKDMALLGAGLLVIEKSMKDLGVFIHTKKEIQK